MCLLSSRRHLSHSKRCPAHRLTEETASFFCRAHNSHCQPERHMICADDDDLDLIEHTKWTNKLWQESVVMYVGCTLNAQLILSGEKNHRHNHNKKKKIPNKNKGKYIKMWFKYPKLSDRNVVDDDEEDDDDDTNTRTNKRMKKKQIHGSSLFYFILLMVVWPVEWQTNEFTQ